MVMLKEKNVLTSILVDQLTNKQHIYPQITS